MLGRTYRFHGYGSLRYAYQHGKNTRGQLMGVRSSANPRRKKYRLAVVVSKKVHKSAVVRNRIRRRIFEICRQQSPNIQGGHDIVLTVFSETAATIPAADLQQQVVDLLERAELIKLPTPTPAS